MTAPQTAARSGPAALLAPGILDAGQLAATVRTLRVAQRPDGAIPWYRGGHLDPWDHVEAAMALDAAGEHHAAAHAYRWLADRQHPDGSWAARYVAGRATDHGRETNFTAYPAVGIWHHTLATGDDRFAARHFPTVRRALDHVVARQLPGGAVAWRDGARDALLTGCSSILHALRCGLALADRLGDPQPDWELAAEALAEAVRGGAAGTHPEFLDKSRYSMDWYYPVLGGALTGAAARERLASRWDEFTVPGLGCLCVADQPWVTGGESAELALALWASGDSATAARIVADVQHLRRPDGTYWTGYVHPDDAFWPDEQTTWTAGSVLLALAVLGGDPATTAVFAPPAAPPADAERRPSRETGRTAVRIR